MKTRKSIGILSAIVGMILYKIIGSYFGVSGQKLLMYGIVSICLLITIGLALMKQFMAVAFCLTIVLPLVMASIGMYLDNLLLVFGGIVLLIIMIFVVLKIYKV